MFKKFSKEQYEGEFNILRHEKELILKAYLRYSGDKEQMAKVLGITKRTLYNKLAGHMVYKITKKLKWKEEMRKQIAELEELNIKGFLFV